MVKSVTTKEIFDHISDNSWILVDIRSSDAYNGWQLNGERRGGHIPGAKSLPAKWLKYIDWIEIVRRKNIHPDHQVVIYSSNSEELLEAVSRFEKSGFKKVFVYNDFVDEWTSNPQLPLDFLPRYKNLVPAEWVKRLISGNESFLNDHNPFLIVHAHYRHREAYLSGHIPGAVDMDTLALEAPETWNRRNPDELKDALENHGITSDTTVVLYGKHMFPNNDDPFPGSAAGDIGAIRCALIMLYAGVKDVRILNGSFQSWLDAGYEVSTEDVSKRPVTEFGTAIPSRPSLVVDTPVAKKMIVDDRCELVCVRSLPEYLGEVSGYNYITKKGRIPGAVFVDCGSDAYHMENYRNVDHTTREYHEIKEIWLRNGITPDKHLAFYCGTGWRGSEAWFNAWLLGWPKVSVYDGGWFEWSNGLNNPYETGVPENFSTSIPEFKEQKEY